jgi:hypothetical protein
MMKGDGGDRKQGAVSQALDELAGTHVERRRLQLCFDVGGYGDAWVKLDGKLWSEGQEQTLLTAEVENELWKFKGWVADLFRRQAHGKIGIFYQKQPSLADRWRQINDVFTYFSASGFQEAPETGSSLVRRF